MNIDFIKISSNDIRLNLINLKQLVFEVTDACNLRCKYCGYGEFYEGYDPRRKGNLSVKKACNMLDFLSELWQNNIGISLCQPFTMGFYGGEPLINMKFIKKIIQYTESLNITTKKIHYNMTTNGLLLNKYMDYLVTKDFDLLISLDGNKKDHSYRVDHNGDNSHKQVVDNVKKLQHKYPEYFKRHVRINTVLHNMNSVESAHQFIRDKFGKKTTISPLNNSGVRKDKVKEYLKMFQNVDSSIENSGDKNKLETELFLQAPRISQLTNFFYKFSGNMFDDYHSLFYNANVIETVPTATCTPFYRKMFVSVNGKILPCERINHEFAMGQVTDETVELNLEQIAKIFNDYVFKFIKQCKTCANSRRCFQCVFQIDELSDPNTKCKGYMTQKSFQEYINTNLDFLGKHPKLYKKIMKDVRIEN